MTDRRGRTAISHVTTAGPTADVDLVRVHQAAADAELDAAEQTTGAHTRRPRTPTHPPLNEEETAGEG